METPPQSPTRASFIGIWKARLDRLRSNPWFEWSTVVIILASSVTIGVKSYDLSPLFEQTIKVLDTSISLYFLTEILIRMAAVGSLRKFFSSGWNVFDFLIVACSLIPINESEYALLARLFRLFRVMRLIYIVPQLRVLVGALLKAVPRITYVALMMFIIFYIYAAVGNLVFKDINQELWGNVGISLLTLFRIATLEDWATVMYETMDVYPLSWTYFLSFIFLSAFVFLNMMIGVIIESLNEEHDKEKPSANNQTQLAAIATHLRNIEERLAHLEPNGLSSPADLGKIITDKQGSATG